jgi:hypothetical protein
LPDGAAFTALARIEPSLPDVTSTPVAASHELKSLHAATADGFGGDDWLLHPAIVKMVYAAVPPAPLDPSAAPHFNPVIYTLDLLLPVVNLGQKYEFNPAGVEQWLSYILIAAGWVLATTIVTSVARILTR